ncbi:LGFP repeat-containing protein [Rhodococcus sp. WMMA185]|uniref:LGFP repeat-containing protein n=1 Tax=Rhodococcus sp. WMMA185 TaxID=679318 RepID=UPI000AF677D2|nr:hypothetical protein [Rhodococcus sp. WMMA185]
MVALLLVGGGVAVAQPTTTEAAPVETTMEPETPTTTTEAAPTTTTEEAEAPAEEVAPTTTEEVVAPETTTPPTTTKATVDPEPSVSADTSTTAPEAKSSAAKPPVSLPDQARAYEVPAEPKKPLDKWAPTKNPNATIIPGQMRSDREEIPEGYTKEEADLAETMEAELETTQLKTTSTKTLACQVFWPAPYEVCGAILDKYNSLGGPLSFLLLPTSNELVNPDGYGRRNTFQNGPIYWSPATGAHPVVNHFYHSWASHGWEGGFLGYPKTDEIVLNGGRLQDFEGATIYWSPLTGAHPVGGAIRDKWAETGWENGPLGYPTSDEKLLPDGVGRMNSFQYGVIYWSPTTGAHPVVGDVLFWWALQGYEQSSYGYPVGDGYTVRDRAAQDFQNGTIGVNVLSDVNQQFYDCVLNLQHPHVSTHSSGWDASVLATAKCSDPKLFIEAHTELWYAPECDGIFGCGSVQYIERNTGSIGDGETPKVLPQLRHATAMPCMDGEYWAETEFIIINADGGELRETHRTPKTYVTCPD